MYLTFIYIGLHSIGFSIALLIKALICSQKLMPMLCNVNGDELAKHLMTTVFFSINDLSPQKLL